MQIEWIKSNKEALYRVSCHFHTKIINEKLIFKNPRGRNIPKDVTQFLNTIHN